MPNPSDPVNAPETAVSILLKKGYQVWFTPASNLYWAGKDGWGCASESPLGLLGVVAVHECA